jgi:hypothetical protein
VLDWSCRIYHDYFKFQCVGLELTAHVAVRVDLYMEDTLWGAVSFAASHAFRKVLEHVTSQDCICCEFNNQVCVTVEIRTQWSEYREEVEPW